MAGHCYRIEAVELEVRALLTNSVPVDAYRGAGKPEMVYLVERLVDRAAHLLNLDPAEIRMRNLLRPQDLPWRLPLGQEIDSGDFPEVLRRCVVAADRDGFEARRAASERSGRLRGLGIGMHMHVSGGFPAEFSLLRVDPDGRLMLHTGTQTGGQGHATVFAQIAAERLGLPVQAIAVQQGDTRALARGGGTGGSSSLPIAGVNIARAAELLIERGRAIAAQRFEAAPIDIDYSEGAYKVRGTDRRLGLFEMAVDEDVSAGCDFDGPTATFPNGAYAMEVEVDPATGAVRLCRFSGVDDLGRVLNPRIARGQIEGGVVQAIGQAMMEEVVYDANGQLLNASLMDYALPRAADVPALTVAFHEVPATTNPLGAKGAGEVGPAGGLAPFVAAVLDALRPLGVETLDMPATPENVWRAIERARTEKT